MTLRILLAASAATLALGLVGSVSAQTPPQTPAPTPAPAPAPAAQTPPPADDGLPDGPGKDVTVRICTSCHEASQFAYARHTPEEWDMEISKMISAGADMTADEQAAISAYLSKNLGPQPAAPAAAGPATPATPTTPTAPATPPTPSR
jgi:cytochrome c5